MRVIHFIYGLGIGGAETLVKNYALGLRRFDDIDLTVLCIYRKSSPYERLLKEQGVRVLYLCDLVDLTHRKFHIPGSTRLKIRSALQQCLRKLRPDVIHYHLEVSWYILYSGIPRGTGIVYTLHADVASWSADHPGEVRLLRKVVHKYHAQLIALNETMQQEMNELFGVKDTMVVNNAVPAELYRHPAVSRESKRNELGLSPEQFVAGHVGRFHEVKNHNFLLEVFAAIHRGNADARLLLAASGSCEVEQQVRDKISELGLSDAVLILRDRRDVNELLKAMDVMIFPSLSEGVPLALIEAQFSGLLCLASTGVAPASRISNLLEFKSLDDGPQDWAAAALDLYRRNPSAEYYGSEKWELESVLLQLHDLYAAMAAKGTAASSAPGNR